MARTYLFIAILALSPIASQPGMAAAIPSRVQHLADAVKTFKVTLSKSDAGHNRTVYIQAKDSSEARQTAKDQNPGWQVEEVDEVK